MGTCTPEAVLASIMLGFIIGILTMHRAYLTRYKRDKYVRHPSSGTGSHRRG